MLSTEADASAAPALEAAGPSSFSDFPIAEDVQKAIAEMGYTAPTAVQSAVIAPALAGRDIVVQSKTGSGKTAAFGIPLLEKLPAGGAKPGAPASLVLAPTRELAHQVAAELKLLAAHKGTRVIAIYGGVPMGKQIAALKQGVDIVVGTPGRLLDHIRRRNLSLAEVQAFVLDEADEMLSMGFWDDVTAMLGMAPATRQTMLFSATLPYEVAKAAAQYLKDPARVDLSGDTLSVDGIENHCFHVLPDIPKPRQLMYILECERPESAIIFCNTRNETEILAKYLTQSGFVAEPISGNIRQRDRERVMARIKSGELKFMVASDIAARGIDINDLSHVVNYSFPEFSEVFLHRVGRTGRIGKMGTAVSLVDGRGLASMTRLEREFGIKFIEKTLPPEEELIRLRSQRIMKELSDKASVVEVGLHMPVAQEILKSPEGTQIIAFLLKQYYNVEAQEAERRASSPRDSQREGPASGGRRHEARADRDFDGDGEDEGAEGAEDTASGERSSSRAGAAAGAGVEGDGTRRRRRRRRRGRGGERGGERSARSADGADHGGGNGREPSRRMDTVSAAELLGAVPRAASSGPRHVEVISPVSYALAGEPAAPAPVRVAAPEPEPEPIADGMKRIRVNIGFDDGFKGRGAVAKKISALAGINEGILHEVESRRDYAVLKATPEIAELVQDRVDGAQIGKKVLTILLQG